VSYQLFKSRNLRSNTSQEELRFDFRYIVGNSFKLTISTELKTSFLD